MSDDNTYVFQPNDVVGTHGGEGWVDDYHISGYGLSIGELRIYDMTPEAFKALAVEMVNHLMVKGHSFEFGFDDHNEFVFRSV